VAAERTPESYAPLAGWSAGVAVLGVLTAARLRMVADLSDQGFFLKYLHSGAEIVAGRLPVERLGDLSPGYLWSVAGLLALGLDRIAIRGLQVVAVSLAALACAAAARARWGPVAAVSAATFVIGSRGALVNATELEPETLILLLHAVATWLLCAGRRPALRTAAGAVLGLSAITRPTVLPVVAAIAAALAWRGLRSTGGTRRRRLLGAAGLAVAAALPVAVVRGVLSVIPGGGTPMNPGTVLYEGLNPDATGYSGEAPQIVKEVELGRTEPDALHIAYRIVAARALGRPEAAPDTNRYWLDRAAGFVRHAPAAAAELVATKAALSVASYEAWDLVSLAMRDQELQHRRWIPFGVTLAAALAGLALARPRSETLLLALLALGPALTMVAFYVTSRQRNALIAPLAVLAGAGVAALWRRVRRGELRIAAVTAAGVVAVALACSVDGAVQREDRWGWTVLALREAALERAEGAAARGDLEAERYHRAAAAIRHGPIHDAAVARTTCELAAATATGVTLPAERFDVAVAAARCGDIELASRLFEGLAEAGYRPLRGARLPSSVAWQQARLALRRGETERARRLLATARREAPADAHVDAMTAVVGPPAAAAEAAARLADVHDPFTGRFALAQALADAGRVVEARDVAAQVAAAIPEWPRPRAWSAGEPR